MHTTAATGLAVALNISFGIPGQIAGVWIYKPDEAKKGFPTGHWTNAGLLFFVAAGSLTLMYYYRCLNSKIIKNGGEGVAAKRLFRY